MATPASRLDFTRRATTPELMDDPSTGYETFRDCLVDLAAVNRLTLAHRPTMAFLDGLARSGALPRGRPLTILDVGSGYGDTARAIDRWATGRGLSLAVTGLDLNPWSARAAAEATPPGRPIRWITADAFDHEPEGGVDLVVSSLFTHHLDDAALVRFIARMEASARIGWFVNDLHRHPLPYHGFTALSRLMRWHSFVRHDGPVSITRAFSRADWRRLLDEAGLAPDAARIAWHVPFRLCVTRLRAS